MFSQRVAPRRVLSRKEFRERLSREFLIVSDVGGKVGRPRSSVLGSERVQLDLLVGVRILDAVLAEMASEGVVLDPDVAQEMTPLGKRGYVSKLLSSMSQFRPQAVPDLPIQSLYKSCGTLIRIRKSNPGKRGDGGKFAYVNKDTATSVEITAALNTHRQQSETRHRRDTDQSEILALALKTMPAGTPLMEAYAIEADKFLSRESA